MFEIRKEGDKVTVDAAFEASNTKTATENNGQQNYFLSTGRGGADTKRTGEKEPLYCVGGRRSENRDKKGNDNKNGGN